MQYASYGSQKLYFKHKVEEASLYQMTMQFLSPPEVQTVEKSSGLDDGTIIAHQIGCTVSIIRSSNGSFFSLYEWVTLVFVPSIVDNSTLVFPLFRLLIFIQNI